MIRLVLYSPDIKLQSLLSSALKSEYQVVLESRQERLKEAVRESGADVLALDFDSNYSSLEQQLEFYNQLGESHIPTVVMTDDLRRSTANNSIVWFRLRLLFAPGSRRRAGGKSTAAGG